jgi:hypothetical protein
VPHTNLADASTPDKTSEDLHRAARRQSRIGKAGVPASQTRRPEEDSLRIDTGRWRGPVDMSLEPLGGDPAHSRDSFVRGTLGV